MKVPLMLMIMAIGVLALSAVGTTFYPEDEPLGEVKKVVGYQPCYSSEKLEYEVDPYPQTMLPESEPTRAELDPFPTEVHLKVIGRMAESVVRMKMKIGGWWECGIFYTDEDEIRKKALLYAYTIVKEAWEVSDPPYADDPWTLNPWGVAGTMWNESKFDRCAFGLHPRMACYEMGLLERNRLTLSHKEEEVLKAVRSEKLQQFFKKSGFDLGVGQLLSRFYPNPKDYENMLSLEGGTVETMRTMRDRARLFGTNRPWKYWPGHKADWYDEKVTRWARLLGATEKEI